MLSVKELKVRHESGEKQMKSVTNRINQQLARECAHPDCKESLAFYAGNIRLCKAHYGWRITAHKKAEIRKKNKAKKKAYYEKHGIVFNKTVRKRKVSELNGQTKGKLYSGEVLVYENYKEPLKQIEKNKGYGYYGTIAQTNDGEYVQCHICGHLFEHVGLHLRLHKVSAEKYKEDYGLAVGTALMSDNAREEMQEEFAKRRAENRIRTELPVWLDEYNKKVQSGAIKHVGNKRREGSLPLEKRNKLGLCPDQVLEKIKELADDMGRTPSEDEFKRHYKGRFYHSITSQHGSYLKAVKKLGLKSAKELKEYTDEELLQALRDFKEKHGYIPTRSDFSRGLLPSYNTYYLRFGTINNARIEAGLNALLPLAFGRQIELTPQEYFDYREGHPVEKIKTKAKKGVA